MLPVEQPFKTYTGLDGKPLDNGYVYFGLPNQDPANVSQRVTVYWDAAGTQPAFQPLRTVNGYIVNDSGSPSNVFFDGPYSELVRDSKMRQVFYARTSDDFSISTIVSNFLKAIAGATGAALMGFVQAGVGAVKRTVESKLRERISVLDFMTDAEREDVLSCTGALDVGASCDKARDYVVSLGRKGKLRFPAGVYSRSTTWDFSYPGLFVEGDGRFNTVLKYTGNGTALRVDDSRPNHNSYAYTHYMANFCIEGNANAQVLLYNRNLHHVNWANINLREANSASGVALRIEGTVAGHFSNIICSTNAQPMASRPFTGMVVTDVVVNGKSARATDNTFFHFIFEGMTGDTVQLVNSDQSLLMGGTLENSSGNGITIAAGSRMNTLMSVSFENEGFADIYDGGFSNKFINCYTKKRIYIDTSSLMSKVEGGYHQDIEVHGDFATLQDLKYSFFDAGGVIVTKENTSTRNLFNASTGALTFAKKAPVAVLPTGSPYTYTNGSGLDEQVVVSGGTVTQIVFNRDGPVVAVKPDTMCRLAPQDKLVISYDEANPPTVVRIPFGANYI